jgi:hypothetical protein
MLDSVSNGEATREVLMGGTFLQGLPHSINNERIDLDSFVELSCDNMCITSVEFHPYDIFDDDEPWEKLGRGLANLQSLTRIMITDYLHYLPNREQPPRDFSIFGIVLPYLSIPAERGTRDRRKHHVLLVQPRHEILHSSDSPTPQHQAC